MKKFYQKPALCVDYIEAENIIAVSVYDELGSTEQLVKGDVDVEDDETESSSIWE